MTFHDDLLSHLAAYKRDILGVEENGVFKYRGKSHRLSHILPVHRRNLNVLPHYNRRFFKSPYSEIRFHRYFHHLNSSQALCINLFFPLIIEEELALVTQFLGIRTDTTPTPMFEKLSEIEGAARKTNFDFHLRYGATENVYFEVKYTERKFGKAPNDKDHRKKFRSTYRPLLSVCRYLRDECKNQRFFLENYQLLRNLVHLGSNSRVVFLIPRANALITHQAVNAYDNWLTDSGKMRLNVIFLEDFVAYLERSCEKASLAMYFREFRDKYLPSSIF